MHKILLCFTVTVLYLDLGLCYTKNISDKPAAIAGGHYAHPGEFPHQAVIRMDGSYLCGGALITYRHIVTAAHCLNEYIPEPYLHSLTVTAGSLFINTGETREVLYAQRHDNFGYPNGKPVFDVAVLTTKYPFDPSPYIVPIRLPTVQYNPNDFVVASGFGRIGMGSPLSMRLKMYSTRIIESPECENHLGHRIGSVNICTYTEYGTGTCYGDSGSPLVSINGELIGIVSWGEQCASGLPDVYTNVYALKYDIEDMVQNTDTAF